MKGAIIHTTLVEKTNACFVSNNNSKYIYNYIVYSQLMRVRSKRAWSRCDNSHGSASTEFLEWRQKKTKYFLNNNSNGLRCCDTSFIQKGILHSPVLNVIFSLSDLFLL